MPKDCTVDEILGVFISAWKMGLKAVAIYRDGSKYSQPLSLKKEQKKGEGNEKQSPVGMAEKADLPEKVQKAGDDAMIEQDQMEQLPVINAKKPAPYRRRLPATRRSITHKFDVAGHEGYITVGLYEDGTPGEVFITMAKEGSTVGGMMDAFATAISLCLQYGVPLEALVRKFSHQRFEPGGMTANPDIPFAKSIVDYLFRWLGIMFIEDYRKNNAVRASRTNQAMTLPSKGSVKEDNAPSKRGAGKGVGKEVTPTGTGLFSLIEKERRGGNGQDADHADQEDASGKVALKKSTRAIRRIDEQFAHFQEDAPTCEFCGAITVRNGNCYKCFNCGASLGCS